MRLAGKTFLVLVCFFLFNNLIEDATVKLGDNFGGQGYIYYKRKVFFVLHHKDNFKEQNALSLFNRLGRYW